MLPKVLVVIIQPIDYQSLNAKSHKHMKTLQQIKLMMDNGLSLEAAIHKMNISINNQLIASNKC